MAVRACQQLLQNSYLQCTTQATELSCFVRVQDTYYLDLSGNYTPHWLGMDIAEQLRADANARLTLDAEYAQARAPLPPSLAGPDSPAPVQSHGAQNSYMLLCTPQCHPLL